MKNVRIRGLALVKSGDGFGTIMFGTPSRRHKKVVDIKDCRIIGGFGDGFRIEYGTRKRQLIHKGKKP